MKTLVAIAIFLSLAAADGRVAHAQPPTLADMADSSMQAELMATRPAFAALPPKERSMQLRWLATGCAIGDENLLARLQQSSRHLDLSFVEAYRLGPPAQALSQLAETQRQNYSAFHARLLGPDATLVPPQALEELRGLSEDGYVEQAVTQQTEAYRHAALEGVALTGTARVLPWLHELLPSVSGALRETALRAISAAEQRQEAQQ